MTNHRNCLMDPHFDQVLDVLQTADSIVLTTHRDPDGDGLGAEAALAAVLQQLGKTVAVINSDPVPRQYRFLVGSEGFETYAPGRHGTWCSARTPWSSSTPPMVRAQDGSLRSLTDHAP